MAGKRRSGCCHCRLPETEDFNPQPSTTKERIAVMPQGDKSAYTDKQKRQASHIAEGYEDRGVDPGEAESRAWATVNKISGGGKLSGSGRGHADNRTPYLKGGQKGGAAAAARPAAARSASAKKAAATRKRNTAKRAEAPGD